MVVCPGNWNKRENWISSVDGSRQHELSIADSFGCDGRLLHPSDLIFSHVDLLRHRADRPCSDPSLFLTLLRQKIV